MLMSDDSRDRKPPFQAIPPQNDRSASQLPTTLNETISLRSSLSQQHALSTPVPAAVAPTNDAGVLQQMLLERQAQAASLGQLRTYVPQEPRMMVYTSRPQAIVPRWVAAGMGTALANNGATRAQEIALLSSQIAHQQLAPRESVFRRVCNLTAASTNSFATGNSPSETADNSTRNSHQSQAPANSSQNNTYVTTNQTSLQRKKVTKKDDKWLVMLEQLKEYKSTNGDCVVPRGYPNNPRLASWVAEQRKQYKLLSDGKQSSITQERIFLLNELDFAWNAQEAAWARQMSDLELFRQAHGHCHVPLSHPDFPKLGLWVKEQRRHFTLMKQGKPSHMTKDRMEELSSIGFCWDTHEATWRERFQELSIFAKKHGHCTVPKKYAAFPKLPSWVVHQQRQYRQHFEGKLCHITQDRIEALDKLGFSWQLRKTDESDSDGSDSYSVHDESESDNEQPAKKQKS